MKGSEFTTEICKLKLQFWCSDLGPSTCRARIYPSLSYISSPRLVASACLVVLGIELWKLCMLRQSLYPWAMPPTPSLQLKHVLSFILLYVYECFVCMSVGVPHACLVPVEARKGCWISWNWSSGWLWLPHGWRESSLSPLEPRALSSPCCIWDRVSCSFERIPDSPPSQVLYYRTVASCLVDGEQGGEQGKKEVLEIECTPDRHSARKLSYIYSLIVDLVKKKLHSFICVVGVGLFRGMHMEVRGQFIGVISLLPPWGSWRLNSGHHIRWQYPAEPFH